MWLMLQRIHQVIMSSQRDKVTPCANSWILPDRDLPSKWESCVETDPRYFRPTEVDFLQETQVSPANARVAARNQF